MNVPRSDGSTDAGAAGVAAARRACHASSPSTTTCCKVAMSPATRTARSSRDGSTSSTVDAESASWWRRYSPLYAVLIGTATAPAGSCPTTRTSPRASSPRASPPARPRALRGRAAPMRCGHRCPPRPRRRPSCRRRRGTRRRDRGPTAPATDRRSCVRRRRRSTRGRSRREGPLDDVVEITQRQSLAGVVIVRHDRGVERLVGGDETTEQPGQHLGIALAEHARALAAPQQRRLETHGVLVPLLHHDVDLAVARQRRRARVAEVEATEVRMRAEEVDLEVDERVQLRERAHARVVEDGVQLGDELLAAPHEDLPEQVVLVLEEQVHGADRELGELRDLLQRGLVEPLAPEHLLGGVEQLRATDVLLPEAALLTAAGRLRRHRTGTADHPRTVDVCRRTARSRSTSQLG